MDQARALARVARSYLAPTISTSPTFTRERSSPNRKSTFTGEPVGVASTINDWLVPVDLTYEIDVWGRIRRGLESARAQFVASADDEAMVRLTVQSDVAQFYYTLRLLDAQIEILEQTVASYREQVRILSVQVKTGLTSPIVLAQADALLQSTLAQQRDFARARADEEHALAILCGQPAPSFSVAANPLREVSPPEVPAGLPAMLLSRRPDVAAAEQAVVASNAQIGVATAAFYPTFSLSSFVGFESANADNLFNWQSRVASIIPGVTLPIFTGGRLKANLEATPCAIPSDGRRLCQSGPDRVCRRRERADRSARVHRRDRQSAQRRHRVSGVPPHGSGAVQDRPGRLPHGHRRRADAPDQSTGARTERQPASSGQHSADQSPGRRVGGGQRTEHRDQSGGR